MQSAMLATFVFAVLSALVHGEPTATENDVDFRYSQPWWQSTICLLDDPDKIVIGKEGHVLLDWGHGWFKDFGVCLAPEIVGGAKWVRQATVSPPAPIMQTWKDAAGVEVLEETFVVTPVSGGPQAQADTSRRIVVLVTLKNTAGAEASREPALHIHSDAPVQFSPADGVIIAAKQPRITASSRIEVGRHSGDPGERH
jgi:hypothetical protein